MRRIVTCRFFLMGVLVLTSCQTHFEDPECEPHRVREISWRKAKRLLVDAPIESVCITHSGHVIIQLRRTNYRAAFPKFEEPWLYETADRRRKTDGVTCEVE